MNLSEEEIELLRKAARLLIGKVKSRKHPLVLLAVSRKEFQIHEVNEMMLGIPLEPVLRQKFTRNR